MQLFLVWFEAYKAANQIANFSHEKRAARILLCGDNQALLLLDGTQGAVERGQPVLDGVIENFAKRGRIVFTRRADIQMSMLLGRGHRVILTSRVEKSSAAQRWAGPRTDGAGVAIKSAWL